ncbi:MAG: autotransporter domain-containing protein [Chlorobiaceae bacterium]|nr:autotransporter domain-containing protein [Chlorobiaceae bacterium]
MKHIIKQILRALRAFIAIGLVSVAGFPDASFAGSGSSSGGLIDVGTLGGTGSSFYALSADGMVIVGYAQTTADAADHAFRYSGGIMTDLGTLVGGSSSQAVAVSADGSVIVGNSDVTGGSHAFKYVGGTMTDLGTLVGGSNSQAVAVSADGSVIVGTSDATAGSRAFKYVGSTMTDLGTLAGGSYSEAVAVSANGSVIVGTSGVTGGSHAFKYVGSTMTDLGTLGGTNSQANAVSANGSVIVGYSGLVPGGTDYHAFKYVGSTISDLGTLGGSTSSAKAVSDDGSVIVGWSYLNGGSAYHAFKYVGSTISDLGTLGGSNSNANAVSANGSVIVGFSDLAGDAHYHAYKYAGGTMTDLGTLGGSNSAAMGVSADGSVIAGESMIAGDAVWHVFLYRNIMVDVDNTYSALRLNGVQLNSLFNLQNTLLTAALNEDCLVFGKNNIGVAVGGRYANIGDPAASAGVAFARLAYRFTPNFRAGVLVDQTFANSVPGNFNLHNSAPMVGVFGAWSQNEDGVGPELKASAASNSLNTGITRLTLPNTEAGSGRAHLETRGIQVEGAWGARLNEAWSCQPFAGVRATRISRSGYAETNVDFPITYNELVQTATTGYAGVRTYGKVLPTVAIRASAGFEQDFSNHIDDYSGSIATLGAFALSPPSPDKSRLFASVGADYLIAKTQRLSVSLAYNRQAFNTTNAFTGALTYAVGF